MPSVQDLIQARLFLKQSEVATQWVSALFFQDGDAVTAARLKDIIGRLADEVRAVEKMIAGRS